MSSILGWIGSICFAFCGAPQAYRCSKQGNADGLSPICLGLWLTGEICYVAATFMEFGWVAWLMFNYLLNILWLVIIFRYYLWPRKKQL